MSNKKILQGHNKALESLSTIAGIPIVKEGLYVWKKYSVSGEVKGDFLSYITSDSILSYPLNGQKGDYWYELLQANGEKIVTWANGTDEEICAMVAAADKGKINLADYWSVGDTRTVNLSAMAATGVGESHNAQIVELVLMHAGGYDLSSAVGSGRTKCSFVVGMKDCLATGGYMNSSDTNSGSWDSCARRTWCNDVFKNAIPSTLLPIFKQFKTITAETYNGTTLKTSVDWFALPAEREIFGDGYGYNGNGYSNNTEADCTDISQFDWYKTAANRIKKYGANGNTGEWWERSPRYDDSNRFCIFRTNGSAGTDHAYFNYGLAPFGCI